MLNTEALPRGSGGQLARNIVHFARVLRAAGIHVGPGKVLAALEAATLLGVGQREDFRAALAALMLDRQEQRALFDEAFDIFWRNPRLAEKALHAMLPRAGARLPQERTAPEITRRLAEGLLAGRNTPAPPQAPEHSLELDAALSAGDRELLRTKDFEAMSVAELAAAKRVIAELRLPIAPVLTRRKKAAHRGRALDLRATLRHSLRTGGEWIEPIRTLPRTRPPALVALCDISGSMARYSRMLLHFLHALTSDRDRVSTFTFGTRLTNVTRQLRHRDVDRALQGVATTVSDWSGGTRIGESLAEFNLRWSRRVLSQGAVVLLITDGLDCGEGPRLRAAMERLRKSCRRILWLNPLLRFEGFEPRAAGIRTMLPHVDRFLPAHNLASLADLGAALSGQGANRAASARRSAHP